jgi:hypothetical protein
LRRDGQGLLRGCWRRIPDGVKPLCGFRVFLRSEAVFIFRRSLLKLVSPSRIILWCDGRVAGRTLGRRDQCRHEGYECGQQAQQDAAANHQQSSELRGSMRTGRHDRPF